MSDATRRAISDTTRRALARAAFAIAAVTVAARVVGFLRVAVFARTVGTNPLGDTYQTANTIPNLVFEIVAGGALAAAVVPVVAGAVTRSDTRHTSATTSALLTWVVLLLTPVALLGALLATPLMEILAGATTDPALRAAKVEVGARMLRIFMPQVVLYGIGIVATGVLQAHRRFLGPALAPLLSSLVVVGCYLTYASVSPSGAGLAGLTRDEELVLAGGTTLGVAVLSLSLLVPLSRLGLRLRPSLAAPEGVLVSVRRLAVAGVVAVAAQQVALAVALRLANAEPGAVVVHQVAFTVYLLPWAVLAVPVATSAFPAMAAAYDASDAPSFASVTAGALRVVLLAMCLAAAVLAAAAWPLSSVVLGSVSGTADALPRAVAAFAPGLVGYGVLALLTRALYARQRARDVAVASATGFLVAAVASVGFAAAFSRTDRVTAIALGNSVGMTVAGLLLGYYLRRAAGPAALAGGVRTLLVCVGAALAAAFVGASVSAGVGTWLGVVSVPILTTGVYVTVLNLARLPAAAEAFALLRRRAAR